MPHVGNNMALMLQTLAYLLPILHIAIQRARTEASQVSFLAALSGSGVTSQTLACNDTRNQLDGQQPGLLSTAVRNATISCTIPTRHM